MTTRATLRASDADREQIADRLRRAATEGRLLPEELEERLGTALSARTYGELDRVVADLPVPIEPWRRASPEPLLRRPVVLVIAALAIAWIGIAAALGGSDHGGHVGGSIIWVVWIMIGWRLLMRRRRRTR